MAIDDSLSADVTATESIYAIYSSPLEARLSILANCEVELTGLQCWLRVISCPDTKYNCIDEFVDDLSTFVYNIHMSHDIRAVFDKGVFRLLEPLDLPDGTCVHLRVHEEMREITMDREVDPAELELQQRALQAMLREVHRLPQTAKRDGLSGRDHDTILYGSQK